MQMKIIALAIAGLVSGAAFAQTNVSVYGSLDVEYIYSTAEYKDEFFTKDKKLTRNFHGIESGAGVNGGGSRLGFQGEEALGNGLKALFKYEWGVSVDEGGAAITGTSPTTSAKGLGARYTYVGLGGDFGTVTLGRDGTAWDYLGIGNTGVQSINGIEPINLIRGQFKTLNTDRWNNAISYRSPKFSGLDFTLMYSFGEKVKNVDKNANFTKDSPSTDSKWGLGVRYANGPVYVVAVYHNENDATKKDPWTVSDYKSTGVKGWALGASYDFKVVKLYANYMSEKKNNLKEIMDNTQQYCDDICTTKALTAWSVGLGIAAGPNGTVSLEYAAFEDGEIKGKNTASGFGIGYRHNLSKRTYVFAALSVMNNDDNTAVGYGKTVASLDKSALGTAGTLDPTSMGGLGSDQTNFSLGIRHFF